MRAQLFLCFWLGSLLHGATLPETRELVALSLRGGADAALQESLQRLFTDDALRKGTAYAGYGPDFVFAVRAAAPPRLFLDDKPAPALRQLGTGLWVATAKLQPGTSHTFHYEQEGLRFGGSRDMPAFAPDSYPQPGVPQGTLHGKFVHTSKIYDGLKSNYWVYTSAQYNPQTPAALTVWQDGQSYINRDGSTIRLLDTIDNLTQQKKMPVMVHVFVSPGDISQSPDTPTFNAVAAFSAGSGRTLADSMRSTEYDTVSDRYPRFLRDELLPEIYAKWNVRRDAYSRAISGSSSGAICAFNAAWQQPDQFSRVLSWIGTYTSIQWTPNTRDGGHELPNMVRKMPKHNFRIWLQDGAGDLENTHGSWPLQNIQMANSLKLREYDYHLSFGTGTHNSAQGSAELPESLTWLWRGYDSAKTEQVYEMDPAEREKGMWRVRLLDRK